MHRALPNIAIALVMAAGIASIVHMQKGSAIPVPASTGTSTIALADQLAAHATRESCWSVINGSVYDLTSWIPNHPGGEQAILQLCGTDGSALFNGQHGGAPRPVAILAGFKIGDATATSSSPTTVAPTTNMVSEDDDGGRRRRGRGSDDD